MFRLGTEERAGLVRSQGGKIRARGSSYVNALLDLNGLEIIHDVFYLIEDLARGVIPFDTSTKVHGELGLLFFKIPIKARVSCEVYVNTDNQTIVRQDCYPELGYGQGMAPTPAAQGPSSDGKAIDQGIAYILLLVALAVTYLFH
ncbi:hypothetical protein GH714_024242 [Hevea brasiliensis]|uniref:Uncharacterized protein n=1 Tax=Hevea brasiliensis TaxID=3981 RepID=A0A6A6LW71_HEVBR|nr:hypothetical protein GH714_024242 [Hevea brasiliensis]